MGTVNKIFWIFFAFAIGFILFASIQNKLPNELSLLKPGGSPQPTSSSALQSYEGWTIIAEKGAVELRKNLTGGAGTGSFPMVGILCDNGALSVRLNPGVATSGQRATEVYLIGRSSKKSFWYKTPSTNLVAAQPKEVLKLFSESTSVQIQALSSSSQQLSLALDPKGLLPLINQFPPSCQ